MGLRCLLGHDFTEPETEHDREERGDEVVVTVRQVKKCRRCGETQVISENTEVTPVAKGFGGGDRAASGERDDDASSGWAAARDDDPDPAGDLNRDNGEFDHPAVDAGDATGAATEDAEILEDDDAESTAGEWPDQRRTEADADRTGREPDDDGTAADRPRRHGEWPDADATHPAEAERDASGEPPSVDDDGIIVAEDGSAEDATAPESSADAAGDPTEETSAHAPWPEHRGDDEGFDAELDDGSGDGGVTVDGNLTPRVDPDAEVDEDAEYIEAEGGAPTERPAASERRDADASPEDAGAGGRTPADGRASAGEGASAGGRGTGDRGTGRQGPGDRAGTRDTEGSPGVRPDVDLSAAAADPDTEYHCPECGLTQSVGASSMRAGDICPECKRGYIEERERS